MSLEHERPDPWSRYARALAGELGAAEVDALRRAAAADAAVAAELDAATSTWHATAPAVSAAAVQRATSATGTDGAWSRLADRMRVATPSAAAADVSPARPAAPAEPAEPHASRETTTPIVALPLRVHRTPFTRRAAIAATLLLALVPTLRLARTHAGERTWRSHAAGASQRTTVYLPDGTRAILRANSTLRVAGGVRWPLVATLLQSPGDTSARLVELTGEALFAVQHDATRPFRVVAGRTVIEDLGTEFSVRAYPAEGRVRVALIEGAVAVRPTASARVTTLRPGDVATADRLGSLTVTQVTVPRALSAWSEDRLAYHDAPLPDVLADLAIVFDARIRLADPALATRRVTLDMPARSLGATLDALALLFNLSIDHADDAWVVRAHP